MPRTAKPKTKINPNIKNIDGSTQWLADLNDARLQDLSKDLSEIRFVIIVALVLLSTVLLSMLYLVETGL